MQQGGIAGCTALAVIGVAMALYTLSFGIHVIDEGHVGVYYRGGKLLNYITGPGYNVRNPYLTTYEQVQVTIQTDEVKNIPCGTSGGVMIIFDKIEVVNQLNKHMVVDTIRNYTGQYDKIWIYDKIHHEINQFCTTRTLQEVYIDLFDQIDERVMEALQKDISQWAPGIQIINIRVTKPRIPEKLKYLFEKMENERANILIENEKQKTELQAEKTRASQRITMANQKFEVAKIDLNKKLLNAQNQEKVAKIESEMLKGREKTRVNGIHFKALKELETIKETLSESYLKLQAIKAVTANAKFYVGKKIPQYFVDNQQRPVPQGQ